ncbi:MAG: hypothetical protein UU47_C0006G0017 [candidate division TM6 bacterium GW2011_GWE2_41_16]|nr:MAG: hypothetical protein UU47_C0006G0017 [candidate division TM6 bacterium GW2011_GWE2_41_16]
MKHTQDNIRILVISGSARRATNCPGADGKSTFFMERIKTALPQDWTVDLCNLSNDYTLPKIQACNACASTSMALCVWPCNCYKRHSFVQPDLMWDEDLFGRIYAADAIVVISPVNWYGPTSSLKLLFDRLVCASGGNPDPKLIDQKNANLAAALENSPQWKKLSQNHLEGRTAAFFVYGNAGADEVDETGSPFLLKHKEYFDPRKEVALTHGYKAFEPIIFQLRYSGIEAPDELVRYIVTGKGEKYNKDQIPALKHNEKALHAFDVWVENVKNFVEKKGKIKPGKYPVPLKKPDSEMSVFARQVQLLIRKTLGSLWMHSFGYFTFQRTNKKRQLKR